MEYFRLEQDKRIPGSVLMQGMPQLPNFQAVLQGELVGLKKMTVMFVPSSKFNQYPPIMDRQIYLVNEQIKNILALFCPTLEWRTFCLIDKQTRQFKFYQAPLLEKLDCLAEGSEYNLDKSVVTRVVIKKTR